MNSTDFSNLAGRDIAGCELIRELGSGSSGTVYLAKQKHSDRMVACKLLYLENDEDRHFIDSIFACSVNAVKLDHPNIVRTRTAGTTVDGMNYLLTEFVDGAPLEQLRTGNPELISEKFLLDSATQIAGALDYAWSKFKIIHGDIKPGNILVRTLDREVKICDLGLLKSGVSEDMMVTPLYAAPEVIRQENHTPDPRSDIYSFGVLLYELCCGEAPFQGSLEEILAGHLNQIPVPLLEKNPDLDPEMANFIDRMISKSPADRPAGWQEVRNNFGGIRKRLYPPANTVLDVTGDTAGTAPVVAAASWTDKLGKQPGIFAKYPLLLPGFLLIVIAAAVAAILIQLL